jgi:HTH-type transcriptional regulator/antitoxin HigA
MNIRPIRNAKDHAVAVRTIEKLWGAPAGTPKGDMLDVLATLVDAYESKQFAMERLDPIETIKAHMDMAGYSQADLAELLGSRSRASEILKRRRALNVQHVHKIAEAWKIPAELLIQPYEIEKAA